MEWEEKKWKESGGWKGERRTEREGRNGKGR